MIKGIKYALKKMSETPIYQSMSRYEKIVMFIIAPLMLLATERLQKTKQ